MRDPPKSGIKSVSCIGRHILYHWATREALLFLTGEEVGARSSMTCLWSHNNWKLKEKPYSWAYETGLDQSVSPQKCLTPSPAPRPTRAWIYGNCQTQSQWGASQVGAWATQTPFCPCQAPRYPNRKSHWPAGSMKPSSHSHIYRELGLPQKWRPWKYLRGGFCNFWSLGNEN